MTVSADSPARIQQALDFLAALERRHIDHPAPMADYQTILTLAHQGGFDVDEADLQQAFVLLMRARAISFR